MISDRRDRMREANSSSNSGLTSSDRLIRTLLAVVVLVAAFGFGVGLRLDSIVHKHGLHVDEAWSYVTATGHLGTLATGNGEPLARWVPAAQWQALWHPGPTIDFRQISLDLARHDVHPALFFWLLAVWVRLFGVTFQSGPLLNLFIDVATGAALYGLARYWLRDTFSAALVVLVWAVSPAVRLASSMTRMFPLLGLFAVLFVWLLVRATDRRGGRGLQVAPSRSRAVADLVLLALATAGGMLTQYQFVLLLVGGAVFAAVLLVRSNWRGCLEILAALAAGLALTFAVQPGVYGQFLRERAKQLPPFSTSQFVAKVNGAVGSVFQFFGLAHPWLRGALDHVVRLGGLMPGRHLSAYSLLTFWLLVAFAVALLVPAFRRWLRQRDKTGWIALVFLIYIGGTIIGQNLAFLSQPAVLSPRYLTAAWPFFAFVPVLVARSLVPRAAAVATATYGVLFLLVLSWGPTNYAASLGPFAALRSAHRAVIDCPLPGVLPVVMWAMPATAQVDVAWRSQLYANPAVWIERLRPGDYFVNRAAGQPQPLDLVRARYRLVLVPPSLGKLALYRVE